MQNPSTKTQLNAFYTDYTVFSVLRWQHTMAIFTTLRLSVVLSTILPYAPDSYFSATKVRLLISSYPFSRAVSIPSRVPRSVPHFGAVLAVLVRLWGASFRPSSSRSSPPRSSAACVLLSASAWADILQRLCPLSSQRKPSCVSSSAPSRLR